MRALTLQMDSSWMVSNLMILWRSMETLGDGTQVGKGPKPWKGMFFPDPFLFSLLLTCHEVIHFALLGILHDALPQHRHKSNECVNHPWTQCLKVK